jgi:ABC-type polysaccharide/polyol phosphate export permease
MIDLSAKNINKKKLLMSSLRVQRRVIGALLLRELITRYGRYNLGFLWLFIEPMIFAAGITLLWSYMGLAKGGLSVAAFAITGYSALVVWRNMVNRLSGAVPGNIGLLYHQQVKVFDLIATRAILEIAACTVSLITLTLLFTSLNLMTLPVDPLMALTGWFMICWFVLGAGFIGAYLGSLSEIFDRVWHVFMYLSLPFTGAFFMVSWLPPAAQEIVLWSPLVNGVEMLREGYFGAGVDARYSVSYLIEANSITLLIGLLLIRKLKRMISAEG